MTIKGLFLPGYACTSQIWQLIRDELSSFCELTCIDWPTQTTADFHDIDDFAHWLCDSIEIEQYDFIVGHSLGGLVALRLTEIAKSIDPTIILVESFLAPPTSFFQNLLLNMKDSAQAQPIIQMLGQEKIHYSPVLGERLRDVDIRAWAIKRGKKFYAFYGDRGSGDSEKVLHELNWPESLSDLAEVTIIPNACHFPMIENSGAVLKGFQKVLHL